MKVQIVIPEQVNSILESLQKAGYEAYVVGGCVRDALLGREPHDWDITTSALPTEVKNVFPRTVDTGLQHGTVTVLCGGTGYEVTTFRVDGVYEDGRHPKEVTFTPSLKEDLRRRDFTINAMAYNNASGLVDLFGGQQDLENGVVRAVGDPVQRFTEDALRIMRAIRFSAQLKTLVSDRPELLRTAWAAGITKEFIPEFDRCMETDQINPHHCYTVGEHILKSVSLVRKDRILRITMFLHDIAKPICHTVDEEGIDHFRGHAEVGVHLSKTILQRLKYDNATIRQVTTLIKYHDTQIRLTEPSVRKAVVNVGIDLFPLLLEVKQADFLAQSTYRREEKQAAFDALCGIYSRIVERGDCLSLKELAVNGNDLIKMGVKPGREVGDILTKMFEEVLDVPEHNNKEYLLNRFVDA